MQQQSKRNTFKEGVIMAKAFSLVSWNVEHFREDDDRVHAPSIC